MQRSQQQSEGEGGAVQGCMIHTLSVTILVSATIAMMFIFFVLIMLAGYFVTAAFVGIGLAEGMIYLKKTDAEFNHVYLEGKRSWF